MKQLDIHIGKPIANTQIYILDKYNNILPIGHTGELCVAGDGVGAGYLNRPELTAEKFIDNPFGEGKLYKTGDLAYWREDGNIMFVGRNDFQVKIRGLRIELGEIENAINSVEGVLQSVVVVRKDETGRQLICAFYTESSNVDVGEIKAAVLKKLPKYMCPHIFTKLEEMPLTSSGKISRRALPEVELHVQSDVEYVAPQTDNEKILARITGEILKTERVGLTDNFFDLGGDSLKAIELISRLEFAGLKTEIKTVFEAENIQALAARLTAAQSITTAEVIGELPATPAQMRVYTSQSMQENSTMYNVPYAFKAECVDIERLQNAAEKLIERHESLRTQFETRDGEIVQVVLPAVDFEVERLNSGNIADFIRPFDLSKAPLMRIGCFENTVMLDMHHIVSDGGTMAVILKELNDLYMGRALPPAVQYREFAARTDYDEESEKYWLDVYGGEIPELEIQTDFPRGQKQTFSGRAIYESLDIKLHNKIKTACKALGITPFVFYMGGFNILLSKFSGDEDIIVGMPSSGRSGGFLETVGMFVNTLALRTAPSGTKSVGEYLSEVKERAVEALKYQNYPYGTLVKKLGIDSPGRNPLFDVMFAYQSEAMTDVVFGDKRAELLPVPITTAKYDITFNIMPRKNDVVIMAEYCTDLYKEKTIRRLIDGYKLVLEAMLSADVSIKDICAISEAEKHKLLYEFNDTKADYPKDTCVHQLFEEQVEKTPDKTALVFGDRVFTYRELNNLSNALARVLKEKGVSRNDIVGIVSQRSYHIVIAILAIWKAGGAYLNIDPNYPQARIKYMIDDAKCRIVLTYGVNIDLKNIILNNMNSQIEKNFDCTNNPKDLCAVIYTSGSTGEPKGALLTHSNLINFVHLNHTLYDNDNCVIGFSIYTFDVFFSDTLAPLLKGKTAVMATSDEQFNQTDFEAVIKRNPNCNFFITPTKLKRFIDGSVNGDFIDNIGVICCGGEVFPEKFAEILGGRIDLHNVYGPAECSMWMSDCKIKGSDISLGKPLANCGVYIMQNGNLAPIGQVGEICIFGDCVGAGYLNRPELTAEKFVDNPFGEGKMYKTGDLAYWREDGNIMFVGRNDFQVKIRGLRIELGEIENAINSVDGVLQSVVVVRKDETGRQLICAFYTERSAVDVGEIKAVILKKLPKYMCPHIFIKLNEMPLTPSGKINRKALPEVDLYVAAVETEYVRPQTDLQKAVAAIMEEILNYSPVGLNDDFFDMGGDSLKAIEFLSKAHNEGIYFNLQAVFDNPTVGRLCEHIEKGNKPKVMYTADDFEVIHKHIGGNTPSASYDVPKTEIGNLFLTGATGYLGIHILADYLENDNGKAYCLVRGENRADSERRLRELLRFYFGDKFNSLIGGRIIVLNGDIQTEQLGLGDKYNRVASDVQTVVHAAASVKHYGSYKYFYDINVESTKKVIEFARLADAKFIHISTLSVSGNSLGDNFDAYRSEEEKFFSEKDLFIDQELENVYVRSKFEAEKAVIEAMGNGLKANICRMGNLTNRASDGKFQYNHESNAFVQRVKGILELGIFPDYLMPLYAEFTPIDEAARAVMTVARHFNAKYNVFHINSTKVVYFDRLLDIIRGFGISVETVSGKIFTEALRNAAKEAGTEHIFETFVKDMDKDGKLNYDSNIRILNDFTEDYLRKLGFEWSEIGEDYLKKYIDYFRKVGYWKV